MRWMDTIIGFMPRRCFTVVALVLDGYPKGFSSDSSVYYYECDHFSSAWLPCTYASSFFQSICRSATML